MKLLHVTQKATTQTNVTLKDKKRIRRERVDIWNHFTKFDRNDGISASVIIVVKVIDVILWFLVQVQSEVICVDARCNKINFTTHS